MAHSPYVFDTTADNFHAHVGFMRAAQNAPPVEQLERAIGDNPDNLEARYQLCALKMTQDRYEEAMQQLLEIVRRDTAPPATGRGVTACSPSSASWARMTNASGVTGRC